jgi:2-aminoadipate transaminase
MLESLKTFMPSEIRWTKPSGGLFLWLTLPVTADTERLLDEAIEEKVTYVPGASFFVDGKGQNTLRLAFSRETADNIAVGIERLAQLFKRHL